MCSLICYKIQNIVQLIETLPKKLHKIKVITIFKQNFNACFDIPAIFPKSISNILLKAIS
jgi:hypothetical protein